MPILFILSKKEARCRLALQSVQDDCRRTSYS